MPTRVVSSSPTIPSSGRASRMQRADQRLGVAVGRGDDVGRRRLRGGDAHPGPSRVRARTPRPAGRCRARGRAAHWRTGGQRMPRARSPSHRTECLRRRAGAASDDRGTDAHDPRRPRGRRGIRPAETTKAPDHRGFHTWRVRDSNPRSRRQLIYSQIPLAAWVTRHRTRPRSAHNRGPVKDTRGGASREISAGKRMPRLASRFRRPRSGPPFTCPNATRAARSGPSGWTPPARSAGPAGRAAWNAGSSPARSSEGASRRCRGGPSAG